MNSQVLVQDVTILAPLDSPNTDGIDPGAVNIYGKKSMLDLTILDITATWYEKQFIFFLDRLIC